MEIALLYFVKFCNCIRKYSIFSREVLVMSSTLITIVVTIPLFDTGTFLSWNLLDWCLEEQSGCEWENVSRGVAQGSLSAGTIIIHNLH